MRLISHHAFAHHFHPTLQVNPTLTTSHSDTISHYVVSKFESLIRNPQSPTRNAVRYWLFPGAKLCAAKR